MEYIKEIQINEAVLHILDNNSEEPVLNEYTLELNEEIYKFLLRHIERCIKDEELKYAVFNEERNIVKDLSQEYLNGENNILDVSKELARQMFKLMKSRGNIPSCDLMVVSISTEHGPMLGIMKMDYIKNYTHSIDFIDDKIGINIVPQFTGLPASSQRIQKCAFIKPLKKEQKFNLMVIDKSNNKEKDEYGSNYFINDYLGCSIILNERDMTKAFVSAAENWTRNNLKEDAASQEAVRSAIKKVLKEEEHIDVKALSEDLFKDQFEAQQDFIQFVSASGVEEKVSVDKEWVSKKLKRVRLKIDKDIDLYINEETYNDESRFEIQKNGDGSINIVIKHVMNYIEK
ncbi:nucleoid-associated protein [Clostridium sp. SYSU_GA19001]|uniref:nucleoid-associated protein n=1 Tax=Clostridium caldaquaticum TaxID=2940653 RepID=UPI002076FF52|nr:nucleoid-associated protein [Clostridium caldaquaticum]MCM8711091.1 nucleoid-associated protein [Clostridium caldaquaticum]